VSKIVDKLHERLHIEEKVALESSEDAHTDELLQRRMSNLHVFITTHYPDSHARKEMLGLIHKMQQLSHEALEHKE
jgi:ribosomal protein S15P/S13E